MVPFAQPPTRKKEEGGGAGGETRYARPCRPVKPLEIMCVVGRRWVRHLWQERCEVGIVGVRNEGWGGDGDGEGVLVVEVEERRRKGREGRR